MRCEERLRNIAGLVGAVDGDIEGKIRNLITKYNKQSWKLENCIVALKTILETSDIEMARKHAEITLKKIMEVSKK